jgi:pilus assembly protein CpaB
VAGVPREGLYILLALGCGIGGYMAQRHYVDAEIDEYKSQLTNKEKIVALKQRVSAGQTLSEPMLEEVGIPKQFAHPRAVRWEERRSVVGNPVLTPVEKGEVLLWNQMDMGVSASVNDKVSEGEKAVTIPVNTVSGAGGLLRPNIRIDVYGIFSVPIAGGEGVAKQELVATRLLQNVVVVAVGTESGLEYGDGSSSNDKSAYNTVTVLVKEKQVEKVLLGLELANAGGTALYCVLRSEMDKAEESAPRTVPASEFLSGLRPKSP